MVGMGGGVYSFGASLYTTRRVTLHNKFLKIISYADRDLNYKAPNMTQLKVFVYLYFTRHHPLG